jgi:hypothetical protein
VAKKHLVKKSAHDLSAPAGILREILNTTTIGEHSEKTWNALGRTQRIPETTQEKFGGDAGTPKLL